MPQTLFVSYSHKDEKHKDYVVGHLGIAEKQGILKTWDDRRIKGGGDWRREIETALAQAKVAVLLVSHHTLSSDFILDQEISAMLGRRDREGLVVYPIVIRACDWEAVDWLKAMNLRPKDGKPLARFSLDRRDEMMAGICREIRGFLDNKSATTTSETLAPSPVDDEIDRLAQQTESLSAELGTTKDALNGMFEILAEQNVPVEQLETKLHEIAERHVELTRLWQTLPKSNDDPEITSRREQAAQALEEGDYDVSAELLKEARSIIRQAREEHQEALDRSLLGETSILSQQGDLERARLNYRKAAEYFAEAAGLVPSSDCEARGEYLMKQASTLYDQGNEFGDDPALVESIDIYRLVLKDSTRERMPVQWAETQNNLGRVFRALGMRESGTERLEKAVAAHKAALEERTRESVPLDWATSQDDLGGALSILGERESGTARLEEAVTAYKAALQERTRERVPLSWAATQNNLGDTLSTLGRRESGTARLEEAVTAHRAAMQELTRDRKPLDWAIIQHNLGNALMALGERESGTARLEEAVTAHKAGLEERPRKRVPLDWATSQNNLGNVFSALGRRESGTARLEEAVTAYKAALEEYTRDRVPLDWAATQNNLGAALCAISERESGTAQLEEAITAYKAALEEFTRDCVPLHWAATQNNLGIALGSLGERESGTALLEEAITAFDAALEEYTRDRVPLDWAMTQSNLGEALSILGARESGTAWLEEAVIAYRAALEERTRERVPLDWAATQYNLGTALSTLGERTGRQDHLETALEALKNASGVYLQEARQIRHKAYLDERMSEIEAAIARLT